MMIMVDGTGKGGRLRMVSRTWKIYTYPERMHREK